MSSKSYLITLSTPYEPNFNLVEFHAKITTAGGILSWWHYIENSYIVVVNENINSTAITNYIMGIAPGQRFFVAEIVLNNSNGFLQKDAWNWIHSTRKVTP